MNNSKYKLLVIWNVVLSTLLLLSIGVAAISVQAANDPPVEIYTTNLDHAVAGAGTATSADVLLNTTTYKTILSVPVNFTGQSHNHHCLVIASANLVNPASGGTGYRYDFSLALDGGTSSWALMQVEMSDNASADDPNYVPVSTNRIFTDLTPGVHTLSFVGREEAAANPNLTVTNSSMSVICVKKLQTVFSESEPAEAPMDTSNDK